MEYLGYIIVVMAVIAIFIVNKVVNPKSILGQIDPWVKKLMEKDYEFLLRVKYKSDDLDINALFMRRIRDGILASAVAIFMLAMLGYLNYLWLLVTQHLYKLRLFDLFDYSVLDLL